VHFEHDDLNEEVTMSTGSSTRDATSEEDARELLGLPELVLEGERGSIQSIERAAAVLGLFNQHTRMLTPGLVAERLGLNRSTAHRYLQSLQSSGFLDSSYGLGPLFDQLSALLAGRQQLLGIAPAIMRELSDRTGLTCVVSFLGRTGAVVTLVEEASAGTIILTVRTGTVLEVRAAQSRVLLAFQSDPAVVARVHAALTEEERRVETAALARVRRDRLAWADLGRIGLASVAAPIFGPHDIQAAIALLGTSPVLSPDDVAGRVELLREAADKLSVMLASEERTS
jgi:DNA-binding IclR family transcriptional regulator